MNKGGAEALDGKAEGTLPPSVKRITLDNRRSCLHDGDGKAFTVYASLAAEVLDKPFNDQFTGLTGTLEKRIKDIRKRLDKPDDATPAPRVLLGAATTSLSDRYGGFRKLLELGTSSSIR